MMRGTMKVTKRLSDCEKKVTVGFHLPLVAHERSQRAKRRLWHSTEVGRVAINAE